MLIASTYTFGDAMWTLFVFFVWVIWFWLLITVFADLFRRHDISGWAKAAWIIFVIVLPYLGVLIYLIVEHKGIAERSTRQAQADQSQLDSYVRSVAATDPATQIANAKGLLDNGTITQAEFDQLKQKALG
jgi:Phospholipase_D-nuclease N-terminal/Short C-terminal domain